jgi:NitT/TauT family transport system substrate-binding protein
MIGLLSHLLFVWFAVAAEPASQKTQLALNWKPEPQFGGFYAADVGGHFKKNGLQVEILPGGAGTPTVQMIAAGKMDFGIVSADEVVMSQSRGGDVVALFAAYQTNPQGIMVHADRGVTSLQDLYETPGILAIQKGLPYALYLERKFPKPKVQIVPYLGGIANYLSDKKYSQQCFVTSEPLAAEKAGAKTKTFLIADAGYNPYTTVLVTRGEVLKKKPKLVKAMVDSVRAGWREYLDTPEATNKRMGELNKSMDAATFIDSAKAQKVLIETEETKKIGLGVMTEERWSTLTKQLGEMKLIPKSPEAKGLFKNL